MWGGLRLLFPWQAVVRGLKIVLPLQAVVGGGGGVKIILL